MRKGFTLVEVLVVCAFICSMFGLVYAYRANNQTPNLPLPVYNQPAERKITTDIVVLTRKTVEDTTYSVISVNDQRFVVVQVGNPHGNGVAVTMQPIQ